MKIVLVGLIYAALGYCLALFLPLVKARFFAPKKRSKAIPRGTAPRRRGRPKKEQAAPDATPLDM